MAAARAGKRGILKRLDLPWVGQGSHRSEGKNSRSGPESQPSRHHRLERRKGAAERSRKERRGKEEGRNQQHPWDFGERELPRASGMSPMVERRTSASRSHCGRRTSLWRGQTARNIARFWIKYIYIRLGGPRQGPYRPSHFRDVRIINSANISGSGAAAGRQVRLEPCRSILPPADDR